MNIYVQENAGGELLASALVVIDRTSFGLTTWEVPRGPVWLNGTNRQELQQLIESITHDARKNHCLSLRISPVTELPGGLPAQWRLSRRHVFPEATRLLNLQMSPEDLLASMKPKGRYNIRLSEKHGVRVAASPDASAFARLVTETASRDGFRAHDCKYYQAFLRHIPGAFLLYAYAPGKPEPIAGLIGCRTGHTVYYYYGASDHAHRSVMAPYALQWAAMRQAHESGAQYYDLFGIAPAQSPDHPWQAVSEFKGKFGGQIREYPPEMERILKPVTQRLLTLKRKLL